MSSTMPADLAEAAADVFVLPTSFAQDRLWFLSRLEPDSAAYNIDVALRLWGVLRLDALEAAVVALVARHETLRTTFAQEGDHAVQLVHEPPPMFPIALVDLSRESPKVREERVQRLIHEAAHEIFDLETGPLLRLSVARIGDEENVLLVSMHHIVSDGWSLGVFMRELGALYQAATSVASDCPNTDELSAMACLAPLPIQFGDYAVWQREWLSGDELTRQESFWRAQLGGVLPTLELPIDHPRRAVPGSGGSTHQFDIPADVSRQLAALARSEGATLYMTLLAIYGVFLHRYVGDDDFVVGSPIAGRTRSETEGLIGMFVNTLALRIDVSGQPTFREALQRVRNMLLDVYAHQDLPFERLVHMLQPVRDRRRTPLFQTMVDMQNAREGGVTTFGDLRVTRVRTPVTTAKFDLQVSFSETPGGVRALVIYPTELFDESTIQRMAEHFCVLASAIAADPDERVGRLPLLTPDARSTVLRAWSSTPMDYPRDRTIVDLVRYQMSRTPDAVAVQFDERTLTYAQLDERANRLAAYLRSRDVGPASRVAVYLERSLDLPVALLAIHRAGGAYIPLDPSYPRERLAFMLADSGARVLVTQDSLRHVLPLANVQVFSLDGDREAIAACDAMPMKRVAGADDLAYVIYTSGSTGRPKGVTITHGSLVNFLMGFEKEIPLGPRSTLVAVAALSFDQSVLDLFLSLMSGARLVIASRETAVDPHSLATLLDRCAATHLQATPSTWRMLVDSGWHGRAGLVAMSGGEALTSTLAEALLARDLEVWNLYGPTEATVYATVHRVTRTDLLATTAGSLPVGRPLGNYSVYVLDAHGHPTPAGVPGEIFVGGDGVSRGYHDRAELNAERFVPDPFLPERIAAGARMYRTGDRGRWRADAVLQYIGRLDFQVKIRGHRIEPGEVESQLAALPGVAQAAVVARPDASGAMQLLAHYVPADGALLTPATIRASLRDVLPEHMIPSAIMQRDALPLTPSGKVDRRALPEPEWAGGIPERAYKAPRTNIEHELVQIWERMLPVNRVGIYDDFFESGGHSLLAVAMLAEVERARGRRVPLSWLFESSTVETLAARLSADVLSTEEPPVLALRGEASGAPIAFVHGDVRGGGWYCRRLATLATPDSPFYVLPTIGADAEFLPWTVEEMAKIHVAALRAVQPRGPYRVGGFCIGGIIAFEMARQLVAAGQSVERLIIVDGAAVNKHIRLVRPLLPLVRGVDANVRLTRQSVVLAMLRHYESRVRQIRRQPLRRQITWGIDNIARRLRRTVPARPLDPAVSGAPAGQVVNDASTAAFASALRTQVAAGPGAGVLLMHVRAASVYIPSHFAGTIDLIWADERPGRQPIDPTRGWGQFADGVRVHPVETTHMGLVTKDLPLLANVLRRVLKGGTRT